MSELRDDEMVVDTGNPVTVEKGQIELLRTRLIEARREIERLRRGVKCIEDLSGNEGEARIKFKHETNPPTIVTDEPMDTIYTFAHILIGRCKADHRDWQKELDDYYKYLKEGK